VANDRRPPRPAQTTGGRRTRGEAPRPAPRFSSETWTTTAQTCPPPKPSAGTPTRAPPADTQTHPRHQKGRRRRSMTANTGSAAHDVEHVCKHNDSWRTGPTGGGGLQPRCLELAVARDHGRAALTPPLRPCPSEPPVTCVRSAAKAGRVRDLAVSDTATAGLVSARFSLHACAALGRGPTASCRWKVEACDESLAAPPLDVLPR
jgi:hypothetical protein